MNKQKLIEKFTKDSEAMKLLGGILHDISYRLSIHEGDVVQFLEKEKWYPLIHVTGVELETSTILNRYLETRITELKVKETK